MANNKIGEAYVEIDARTSKLQKGLQDAEKQTSRSSAKMEGSLKSVGERLDSASDGARKFQGALTGIVGVVTGLAAVFTTVTVALRALNNQLRSGREAAEGFWLGLRSDSTNRAQLDEINKKIDKLNATIAVYESLSSSFAGKPGFIELIINQVEQVGSVDLRGIDKIKEELQELERIQFSLRNAVAAEERQIRSRNKALEEEVRLRRELRSLSLSGPVESIRGGIAASIGSPVLPPPNAARVGP